MIYKLGNKTPKISDRCFIAENAVLIGDISLAENVTVWFSAVLRADMSRIEIGANSNVQDNTTIHGDTDFPVIIGEGVTIGHNCIIHGCSIGDNSLIGMGAILLNGAKIPKNCIVGAGSVVSDKLVAEEGSLIIGSPAKVVKKLSEDKIEYIKYAKDVYLNKIDIYNTELEKIK